MRAEPNYSAAAQALLATRELNDDQQSLAERLVYQPEDDRARRELSESLRQALRQRRRPRPATRMLRVFRPVFASSRACWTTSKHRASSARSVPACGTWPTRSISSFCIPGFASPRISGRRPRCRNFSACGITWMARPGHLGAVGADRNSRGDGIPVGQDHQREAAVCLCQAGWWRDGRSLGGGAASSCLKPGAAWPATDMPIFRKPKCTKDPI